MAQNRRVADEERAACQQPGDNQADAPGASFSREEHRQAEPEQQDSVRQRNGKRRPFQDEERHQPSQSIHRPRSFITRALPSASQAIRRPSRTMIAARVRATFSSLVVSPRPHTA